jgi:hypothetical protein
MSRIITLNGPRVALFHDEANDEEFVLENKQDVTDLMDLNKRHYNDGTRGGWGDGRVVARIPLVIWDDLVRRGIADDDVALAKWLDDPDNLAWRATPGLLSR